MRRISMTLAAVSVCIAGVRRPRRPRLPRHPAGNAEFAVARPSVIERCVVRRGRRHPSQPELRRLAEGGRCGTPPRGPRTRRRPGVASTSPADSADPVQGVAKQSVNYFDVGLRYPDPTPLPIEPYVSLGVRGREGVAERHVSLAGPTSRAAARPVGSEPGGRLGGI